MLAARAAGDEKDEWMLGGSDHSALLLTAVLTVDIAASVVDLFGDEQRVRIHVRRISELLVGNTERAGGHADINVSGVLPDA
jgi:hypothetical protein